MSVGVQIAFSIDGAAAWAAQSDRRGKALRAALRKIDRRVLSVWARTGGTTARPGLGDRFDPTKQQRFNFARRAEKTEKAKRRRMGAAPAYVSQHRKVHMRDLVRVPGSGHRVSARRGTGSVETTIRLPGARVLNLAGQKNPKYLSQFMDTSSPGFQVDAAWISRERQRLLDRWLKEQIARARRRGKRGKGRARA